MSRDSLFTADHKLIHSLVKRSQPVECAEGRVLFAQGDPPQGLYMIQSGAAALIMKSAAGNVVMCLQAAAGSLLGLSAIIMNEPYAMTGVARKGSEIRFISRNDYEDLMRVDPSLSLKVLRVLAREVRAARRALAEA